MFRNLVAILMSICMVLPLHGWQQNSPTIQEQVGKIATGSIVEVKTKLKDKKKVSGRLGEVTAEGFEVQVAQGQKMDTVRLRFADVKNVAEQSQHKGTHPGVWMLAGAGAFMVVVMIIAAATAGFSN